MATLVTRDGTEIEWPHARGFDHIATHLSAEEVGNLLHVDYATRCVHISQLSSYQLQHLYRGVPLHKAKISARIGKRITETNSLEYAEGLGRKKIERIYQDRSLYLNPQALKEVLISET